MEEVLTSATPAGLLNELRMRHVVVAAAQVEELEGVYAWALAHPALGDTEVLSRDEHPGGEGTPGVAAFTAEPLAGALGISPYAAQGLLADTLDLRHRLPRTWDQVQGLMVPVWKARKIAKATRDLPLEAARWVDRQLIGAAASIASAALDRLINLAVARVDPEGQKKREDAERAGWDVTLNQPRQWAGTSELKATGDTVALGAVMDRVTTDADALAAAGDTDPVGARRVKALVSLARDGADQLAFGFAGEDQASAKHEPAGHEDGGVRSTGQPRQARQARQALKLYVHTSLADLVTLAAGKGEVTVAEVERFGPITSDLLKTWLDRTRVTVTPVLDLADAQWSPRHDPPPRMREQVVLRHRGCVFPYCGRDARSADLDHVEPWDPDHPRDPAVPGDPTDPSGTTPDNLAPLCRRHHRAKTHGRWRYEALPDPFTDPTGDPANPRPTRPPEHLWVGPHGETFLVTGGRTVALNSS